MALLPPDSIYTIRNVDNVPVYSLAFSFLPGGLERLLAGSKNGYVYAYNLQVSPHTSKDTVYHNLHHVRRKTNSPLSVILNIYAVPQLLCFMTTHFVT